MSRAPILTAIRDVDSFDPWCRRWPASMASSDWTGSPGEKASRLPVAMINMNTMAWSFRESLSEAQTSCGQIIVQAELPVTIIAVQRAIILRSCIQDCCIIAATEEVGDTVQGRRRFGRVGIERDDRTVGEAGALAE
ncbi:hypothetical protein AnigIFM63309_001923 [Aspergillus niger]|nr:hypothetical protein AnigIFM63309_001923 [Aspergillus niger]